MDTARILKQAAGGRQDVFLDYEGKKRIIALKNLRYCISVLFFRKKKLDVLDKGRLL